MKKPFQEKNKFFKGEALYGDDFNDSQLRRWYQEEKDSFFNMHYTPNYIYHYTAIDKIVVEKFIIKEKLVVLGIGSADGQEFKVFAPKIEKVYIVENANYPVIDELKDKTEFIKANYIGKLSFKDNYFDLIVCYSSLHHIANVSYMFKEFQRVLKPSGLLFVREPIISMGNWETNRAGLTKNERGIPIKIFRKIIRNSGFSIKKEVIWNFRPFGKLINLFYKKPIHNSILLSYLDIFFSALFYFNYRYHSTKWWHKISPSSIFYILSKNK